MSYNHGFDAKTPSGKFDKNGNFAPTGERLFSLVGRFKYNHRKLLGYIDIFEPEDWKEISDNDIRESLSSLEIDYEGLSRDSMIDRLKKYLRYGRY